MRSEGTLRMDILEFRAQFVRKNCGSELKPGVPNSRRNGLHMFASLWPS